MGILYSCNVSLESCLSKSSYFNMQ